MDADKADKADKADYWCSGQVLTHSRTWGTGVGTLNFDF